MMEMMETKEAEVEDASSRAVMEEAMMMDMEETKVDEGVVAMMMEITMVADVNNKALMEEEIKMSTIPTIKTKTVMEGAVSNPATTKANTAQAATKSNPMAAETCLRVAPTVVEEATAPMMMICKELLIMHNSMLEILEILACFRMCWES